MEIMANAMQRNAARAILMGTPFGLGEKDAASVAREKRAQRIQCFGQIAMMRLASPEMVATRADQMIPDTRFSCSPIFSSC